MYHLSQEEFLGSWEPIREGDACIIAQDEGFLEQIQREWKKPADWCGYQKEGHVVFRQAHDVAEATKERAELLRMLETDPEYIWGQNYIREEYRCYAAAIWKRLQEEAAEQGFTARYEGEEICFDGEGDPSPLCYQAAEMTGYLQRLGMKTERRLQNFRKEAMSQLGVEMGEAFSFVCPKAWQRYQSHRSLWNRLEDGKYLAGQLMECGVLVVPLAELLQERSAYEYLKKVLQERVLTQWQVGEELTVLPEAEPIPYEGRVLFYGSRQWVNLWEQMDPEWAASIPQAEWRAQCRIHPEIRRSFRKALGRCSLRDEEILWNMLRRGARPGYIWTDLGRIWPLREAPERLCEEALTREDEWWDRQEVTPPDGVGRVHGMAVIAYGEHRTGIPITITALCRRKGSNRSLENTCGPIYRKGMEILKEYWQRLGGKKSFSLSIEGNYGYLEGDSATAAQLYAVLSAATGIVPRAKIAVTGALGLTGEILTVGGINEKIEGWYRAGGQGILYPAGNQKDLCLRPSVEKAVQEGRFRLWGIHHVEEGTEILFCKKWKWLRRKI